MGLHSRVGNKEESEVLPEIKMSLLKNTSKEMWAKPRCTGTRMMLCKVYKTGFCIFI